MCMKNKQWIAYAAGLLQKQYLVCDRTEGAEPAKADAANHNKESDRQSHNRENGNTLKIICNNTKHSNKIKQNRKELAVSIYTACKKCSDNCKLIY